MRQWVLITAVVCCLLLGADTPAEPAPQEVLNAIDEIKRYLGTGTVIVELVPAKVECVITVRGSCDVNGDGVIDLADVLKVKDCKGRTTPDCLPATVDVTRAELVVAGLRRER